MLRRVPQRFLVREQSLSALLEVLSSHSLLVRVEAVTKQGLGEGALEVVADGAGGVEGGAEWWRR